MNRELKIICKIVNLHMKSYVLRNKEFKNNMTGSCLVCSELLQEILAEQGFTTEVVIGEFDSEFSGLTNRHAFLLYLDYIIDITSEQFNKPSVRIIKRHGKAAKDYKVLYRGKRMMSIDDDWPLVQTLFYHRKNLTKTKQLIKKQMKEKRYI